MFPKTSLLLGSSLIWSVLPLTANTITGTREKSIPKWVDSESADLLGESQDEAMSEEFHRDCQILRGLCAMFEDGDKRIMPVAEFFVPITPDAEISYPRIRQILGAHAELLDEAYDYEQAGKASNCAVLAYELPER